MYYPSLSAVLAFLLVFRINMAYQRYWEGRTAMQTLLSKLGDIALQTKAFVLSEDHEARAWKDRMGESHRPRRSTWHLQHSGNSCCVM